MRFPILIALLLGVTEIFLAGRPLRQSLITWRKVLESNRMIQRNERMLAIPANIAMRRTSSSNENSFALEKGFMKNTLCFYINNYTPLLKICKKIVASNRIIRYLAREGRKI